jgi:Carbohydrate esterase, sialic acid-specific acetylesterase
MLFKRKPLLIILTGESNAGGLALNTDTTTAEMAINPKLKYLNNTTLLFEDYDILKSGKGHFNIEGTAWDGTRHGWDLQISNLTKINYFKGREVYLVKTGQGASTISQWAAGSTYETKFNDRVNAAKTLINKPLDTIILYSQGINDIAQGLSSVTWKAATKARINAIKALNPKTPIVMTLFEAPMTYLMYNTIIKEVANEITGVYVVSTSGLTLLDTAHWDYAAMKILATKMLDTFKTINL